MYTIRRRRRHATNDRIGSVRYGRLCTGFVQAGNANCLGLAAPVYPACVVWFIGSRDRKMQPEERHLHARRFTHNAGGPKTTHVHSSVP